MRFCQGLLDAVSDFGYGRVAERDIPRAMANVERADAKKLGSEYHKAMLVVDAAVQREIGALQSIQEIYSGAPGAQKTVAHRVQQWELYRAGLRNQLAGYAKVKAAGLGVDAPRDPGRSRHWRRNISPSSRLWLRRSRDSCSSFPRTSRTAST